MNSIYDLNPHHYETSEEVLDNLVKLYSKLNDLQNLTGITLVISSALRSRDDQDKLIRQGKTKAFNSLHLTGCAADIYDPDKVLKKYIKSNIPTMINLHLWFERFDFTPDWVHIQIIPPSSGRRFFSP